MRAEPDREPGPRSSGPDKPRLSDFLASLVVFLVAVPLCIGIAVACGVPPERGLVTGIIGGIVVGSLAGAPLLVSGPAASLIVPVFDLVRSHGLAALAPVVMLAGLWQAIAGIFRLGQWFRAVAPAVIQGMLTGIGILIFASQLHVAIDGDPSASFVENLIDFPGALLERFASGSAPVIIGASTIVLLVGWNRFRPQRLHLVPGHLVALVTVTLATLLFGLEVRFLDISPNFFRGLAPVAFDELSILRDPSLIGLSFTFAFVASAATLLTASAIDQRQSHSQANFDREMLAQGVGNMLTGSVGGLPMTGVIVRSSVNVDAGARTRLSTILHGTWILVFVLVAPQVLESIPRASLGAILVYTGYGLVDRKVFIDLYHRSRGELVIGLITLSGVVFLDLFTGIVAGLAAAFGKLIYTFSRLDIRSEASPSEKVHHIHLAGSATFLRLPRLAQVLDQVPADRELHVHIDRLDHIDHACLELLSSWNRRREGEDAPGMVVEWHELTERYRHAIMGAGARDSAPSASLLSLVWAEWKRIYGPRNRRSNEEALSRDWIDGSRVLVKLEATRLEDVIEAAAELLAPAAHKPAADLARALRERVEGHVALGDGVSLPHAPIAELDRPLAALVTTREPLAVGDEEADLFFVLLAPEDDPRQHLRSLAHVGRLCHDGQLLDDLRRAETAAEGAALLEDAERAIVDADSPPRTQRDHVLAIFEVEGDDHAAQVSDVIGEAFRRPVALSDDEAGAFQTLRRVLNVPGSRRLLLLSIEQRDIEVLNALLTEQARLFPEDVCRLHVLREDSSIQRWGAREQPPSEATSP